MNDNITLPRSVVEHVMYHLNRGDADTVCWADGVIKPALEQPQGEREPVAMAKVVGMDEYGPMLLWNRAWTDFPVGTKLYTHPKPQREPQFDAISVDQERLAEQFCAEIAGPRGGKPSLPDPVRLLEMAEALYRAEAHQNGAIERAHRIGGEA